MRYQVTSNRAAINPAVADDLDSTSRVLFIDDDELCLERVRRLAKRLDMTVWAASTEDDLPSLLRAHRVNCVVSDLHLPGRSGLELIEALKHPHGAGVVRWCVCSTVTPPESVVAALRVRDISFLLKDDLLTPQGFNRLLTVAKNGNA